jgi:hypothetical protein
LRPVKLNLAESRGLLAIEIEVFFLGEARMHAVFKRIWTLCCVALVTCGVLGCRGSHPFGSTVQVTQDVDSEFPEIEVPPQRLAVSKPRTPATAPTAAVAAEDAEFSNDIVAERANPQPSAPHRDRLPEQNKRRLSSMEPSIDDVALPRSEADELMLAFKDYPPAVQREALRRLIAASARTAEPTDHPHSVTEQIRQRLTDLPELPTADTEAAPATRIAQENRPRIDTEIDAKPIESEVAQVAQAADSSPTATEHDLIPVVATDSEANRVAQASAVAEMKDPPSSTALANAGPAANAAEPPPTLSRDELFEKLVGELSVAPVGESEADRASRLIKLRHLMVLSGDPDSAVEQIAGMGEAEQEFLRHQLLGLWTMIDPQGHPVPSRRFSTAIPQIREAARFAAAATDTLDVRSLAFCTEIESYGQVKPFKAYRFDAGQQVILYCEIENFTARKTDDGYETHLQGSYDLLNDKDEKVVSQLLPADQQVSANHLRDYFIAYQMHLPEQLTKGKYRLKLTMEDVNGKKYGQASIPLEIK